MPIDDNDPMPLFITWTTYGSWLPGDSRGWKKWKNGQQEPQPVLEEWCKDRMNENAVLLSANIGKQSKMLFARAFPKLAVVTNGSLVE